MSGIGRRLAYPVAGEPNVVPKFAQVASACRLRSCLYAWLGSLPCSPSEDAGQREFGIPASWRLSLEGGNQRLQ